MSKLSTLSALRAQAMNRIHARLSGLSTAPTAFVSQPEPRTIGHFSKGKQLLAGNLQFAGHLIEAHETSLWDIDAPDESYEAECHGFAWLDDLASVGDLKSRKLAQDWLWGWIKRYGKGKGTGWTPDLTGRRMIRWINHGLFILQGNDKAQSDAYYKSLARQTRFLGRSWKTSVPGLPRFEALTGLIYAGIALEGMEKYAAPASKALAKECKRQIDDQGGIPTRNPEELLEVFTLLTWAAAALQENGDTPHDSHTAAIERIAPTLRALRHADGGLARFHGGGRGIEGRLDHALAVSSVKTRHADGLAMGFSRLGTGRTSIICDASAPPVSRESWDAHASTLAFELTSGRRPLIVNCGSGAYFGQEWRQASRATPSHSTLTVAGLSSSRLGASGRAANFLVEIPKHVPLDRSEADEGPQLECGHDGYLQSHGLTHARKLNLSYDGRQLDGEDMLLAIEKRNIATFSREVMKTGDKGIPFDVRFHLHPDVSAELDMGGTAVSLALKSGELWVFRHDGSCEMTLEPSVYLEKGRIRPRAAQQIVLSSRAIDYATRTRWSLAKATESSVGLRDVDRDDIDL